MRKGQITMESLLLYGLAILVVLLAIGALTYFGVLDLGRALPDRCTLTSSGQISCEEWAISRTGGPGDVSEVRLGIKNVGARTITISEGRFTLENVGTECTFAGSQQILPGEIKPVNLVCPSQFTQNVGQKVRGTLEVTFGGEAVDITTGGSLVATLTS